MKRWLMLLVAVIGLAWMAAPAEAHPWACYRPYAYRPYVAAYPVYAYRPYVAAYPAYGYSAYAYPGYASYYAGPVGGFYFARPGFSIGFGW